MTNRSSLLGCQTDQYFFDTMCFKQNDTFNSIKSTEAIQQTDPQPVINSLKIVLYVFSHFFCVCFVCYVVCAGV